MSLHFTEFSVATNFSELPGLIDEISRQARLRGLSDADSGRLQLVVEELFSNTIKHGFGGQGQGLAHIGLSGSADHFTLRYTDSAPPFDTGKIVPNLPSTASIGGLGLILMHGMARAVRYQRCEPCNITEIDF